MIFAESVHEIMPLARIVASHNAALVPIEGELLEPLYSSIVNYAGAASDKTFKDIGEAIHYLSSEVRNAENISEHDILMAEIVPKIAGVVRNTLNLTRNVVIPLIKETAPKVEALLPEYEAIKVWDYTYCYTPFLWENPFVTGLAMKYASADEKPLKLTFVMPALSAEQLKEAMHTGTNSIDEFIDNYENFDRVAQLYRRGFELNAGNDNINDLSTYCNIYNVDKEDLIILLLLSFGFSRNIVDNVNTSAEEYKLQFTNFYIEIARRIALVTNRLEADAKAGRFIQKIDATKARVYVEDRAFRTWLDNMDGDSDALLGAMATDRETNPATIVERKAYYVKAYGAHVEATRTANRANRNATVTRVLHHLVTDLWEKIPEEHRIGDMEAYREHVANALNRARTFTDDYYSATVIAVTYTYFAHTDVPLLLQTMSELETSSGCALAESSAADKAKQIATMATIQLVTKWVAGLITVKK